MRNAHRMTSMRTLAVQPRERMEVRLRLEEEQSRHLSDKRESVKVPVTGTVPEAHRSDPARLHRFDAPARLVPPTHFLSCPPVHVLK